MNLEMEKIHIPNTICLRVTRACNLSCPFCQAPPTDCAEVNIKEITELLQRLSRAGVKSVKLTGGEPYTLSNFNSLILECAKIGIQPVVCTNATLMSAKDIEVLKKANAKVKVSLHGAIDDHNRIADSDSGELIWRNITTMLANSVYVSLHSIIDFHSFLNLETFLQQCVEAKIPKVSLIALVPRGRAKKIDTTKFLTVLQLEQKYEQIKKRFSALDLRLLDFSKPYYVIESDGSLWIQRDDESKDTLLSKCLLNETYDLVADL